MERVREESCVVGEMRGEIERDEVGENEERGGERWLGSREMRVESEGVEVVRDSVVIRAGEKGGCEGIQGERFVLLGERRDMVVVVEVEREERDKENEGEEREESA